MSVVIVGGNDRMACEYKRICKSYNCKAKVFIYKTADFRSNIGSPDLLVLFTSTVSHGMVNAALKQVSNKGTLIERSHSSSSCALKNILANHCTFNKNNKKI